MVNGVLVERTVEDVLPSLKTNSDGLKQVLEELLKQYKSKQTDLDNWKVGRLVSGGPRMWDARWIANYSVRFSEEEQHPGCTALEATVLVLSHGFCILFMQRYTLKNNISIVKSCNSRLSDLLSCSKSESIVDEV